MADTKKACLVVIDGWGINPDKDVPGDAIRDAETPVMDSLERDHSFTTLAAHGRAVGLPAGLMGNSEVGHLNIGAGRVVYQDIVRIDVALEEKQFGQNETIKAAFDNAKAKTGRLHFCGLVSDGGVHAHIKHLVGLLEAAKEAGVPHSYVHFFADGRDTNPRSTTQYLKELQTAMNEELKYGELATIVGRYFAMDRDKRWERVQIAFDAMTLGKGEAVEEDSIKTVEQRYAKDETDEFLKPIIVNKDGMVKKGDTMFFFDFRSDRMREITQSFGVKPMPFDSALPEDLYIATMTQYKSDFPFPTAFPPQKMTDVLAAWLAKQGKSQVHVAETEKYAHVTFFFNGGTEAQFQGEERDLIPSPKVATYDLQPEMSAEAVGDKMAEELSKEKYDFVMCNFAPPDMVGHTGIYEAAVKANAATDKAIGVIFEACKKHGYTLFVTADHGNAEKMLSDDGQSPHTAHTCSRVPFMMAGADKEHGGFVENKDGKHALCDVAPTILKFMGLDVPEHMTGNSLLE